MKIEKRKLKFAVVNKETNKVSLFYFKLHVAKHIGISVRTLDRNINYKNQKFEVYEVKDVNV